MLIFFIVILFRKKLCYTFKKLYLHSNFKPMTRSNLAYLLLLFTTFLGFSQAPKKSLQTIPTKEKISIDGEFNEEIWKNAPIATDFLYPQYLQDFLIVRLHFLFCYQFYSK